MSRKTVLLVPSRFLGRALAFALPAALGLFGCQRGSSGSAPDQNEPLAATARGASSPAPTSTPAPAALQELTVEGMHCATCPLTVRTSAERVEGVQKVRVSMEDARVWVTYDPSVTNPQAIAGAISEAGYPAQPADGKRGQ